MTDPERLPGSNDVQGSTNDIDDSYPYEVVAFFVADKLEQEGDISAWLSGSRSPLTWIELQTMMDTFDRLVEETCQKLGLSLPPGWQRWDRG